MKQVRFFAVDDDLISILNDIEQHLKLQYVDAGVFPAPSYNTYQKGVELPRLGVANDESSVGCKSYLVAESISFIQVRPVVLRDGRTNFCIDQLDNPDSVIFTPAGKWDDDVVLHGLVGTASDSLPSIRLTKAFEAAFRKHFKKVKAFWVGPHALELLKAGKTLTIAAQSPKEFSLSLD